MSPDERPILAGFARHERHSDAFRTLLRAFGTPSRVLRCDRRAIAEACEIALPRAELVLADLRSVDPDRERALLEETGTAILAPDDREYPPLLREIHDPPIALFVRGEPAALSHPMPIAIVGTRKPTPYGAAAARGISSRLGAAGAAVVSGLALGIDVEAHAAALDARGTTIAVLGSAVEEERIGPRSNLGTARRIVRSGGAIVSEYPPGTEPAKHRFPMRNRIIAGICRGTVVVEAAEKSGALITARAALEGGRDVFAVPGPFTSPSSLGSNRLIGRGATPICGWEDLAEWYGLSTAKCRADDPAPIATLLAAIAERPKPLDVLARDAGMPIGTAAAIITDLEIAGRVKKTGDRYSPV